MKGDIEKQLFKIDKNPYCLLGFKLRGLKLKKLSLEKFLIKKLLKVEGYIDEDIVEFVPSHRFLKPAEEVKAPVDGWNITDGAAGIPAPSDTTVGCVLKTKYPGK